MNDLMIYYLLTMIMFVLTFGAQTYVRNTYKRYLDESGNSCMNGASVAQDILNRNGLYDVSVVKSNGYLSDHYDPRTRQVVLSSTNYESNSISAIAIAAHECGHALQHQASYAFLSFRSALLPVANISSYAGYMFIMMGIFLDMINLVWIGILLESVILLFQLVTLPVEFDASSRALNVISNNGYLSQENYPKAKSVLTAAALTYVASVAATLLQIMRLLLSLFGTRRNRR